MKRSELRRRHLMTCGRCEICGRWKRGIRPGRSDNSHTCPSQKCHTGGSPGDRFGLIPSRFGKKVFDPHSEIPRELQQLATRIVNDAALNPPRRQALRRLARRFAYQLHKWHEIGIHEGAEDPYC